MSQTPKHLAKHASSEHSRHGEQASTPRHLKPAGQEGRRAAGVQEPSARAQTGKPAIPTIDAGGHPTKGAAPQARLAAKQSASAAPMPPAKRKRRRWPIVLVIVIVVILALAGGSAYAWVHGWFEDTPLEPLSNDIATLIVGERFDTESMIEGVEEGTLDGTVDKSKEYLQVIEDEAAYQVAHDGFPTPLVAEYDGVLIHSPVHAKNLNGVLFHQAATKYGLPLETKMPDADEEKVYKTKSYDFAKLEDQTEGDEYLKGKALHLWRRWTPTEMDSSIDVGAEAGDTVYAPVTGTVVLVRTYRLYDTCDDYEIHIQPGDRDDLDVVEIHVSDVTVKAGDKVEGGVTPMAKVRDLAKEDITDIQLAFYTKPGHGNHTHVQVNDVNYKDKDGKTYRETRLKDAIKV